MATLTESLDNVNYENKCHTENGALSYGWNNTTHKSERAMQEKMVQFYFQCVLNKNLDCELMMQRYDSMIMYYMDNDFSSDKNYFSYLMKMAFQTRDVEDGKGMNTMSYYMLSLLAYYCFEKNMFSESTYFKMFRKWLQEFEHEGQMMMPYGSWKDLKHYLYLLNGSCLPFKNMDQLIDLHIEELYIKQMIEDRKNMSIHKSISLCGKWLPRESSNSYKWLARRISRMYYYTVFSFYPIASISSKHYRKLCSEFNTYLDTVQIHMCNRTWDKIDFEHVTALSMYKYKNAFMNHKKINEEHREKCKFNLLEYIENKMQNQETIKAKTLFPHQLVREVLNNFVNYGDDKETAMNITNLQWKELVNRVKNSSSSNNFLNYCIPCIDVSPSMYNTDILPLISSIGMGLMAMECSTVKRSFTFSETPQWIEMNDDDTFCKKVSTLGKSEWGSTTDIFAMFEMILHTCISNEVENDDLGKYTLFIFSDMQFNECCNDSETLLIDKVSQLYKQHGYTNIPYLIFWNLRTTNNFPSIEKTPNCTKLSGNSAMLFKLFMNTSLDTIKTMTNWTLLKEILDNPRYQIA